jgi:hypothetical protein
MPCRHVPKDFGWRQFVVTDQRQGRQIAGILAQSTAQQRLVAPVVPIMVLTARLPDTSVAPLITNDPLETLRKMVGVAGFEPTTPSPPD